MEKHSKIIVVGAGLAGSLCSVFLAKRGYHVEVYERRSDMRKTSISAGRSINMALSTRGIHALQQVGLDQEIMQHAIPMKGRMIHSLTGELHFQAYGQKESEVIYSIPRGLLNMVLLEAAEQDFKVHFQFNQRCTGINLKLGGLHFTDENTGKETEKRIPSETVIATDGYASAIRMEMIRKRRFNFSQEYLSHGYKELTIPPSPQGGFLLEKHALHIWPRGTYMLIALPNLDGSFTCTLFFPFEGENSFESLNSPEKIKTFFQEQFPDATPLMPSLIEDFLANPTGALVTVKCNPWSIEDKVLLLGDSAHAMVPFFGQGMNCAFEDCTYLDECIERFSGDWLKIFKEYEALRKVNTDAISDLALENFIEMRDLVADPHFLLKKKVGLLLEQKYPELFIPKYSMVTFHRIPYSSALHKGKIQDKILETLCRSINDIQEIDWKSADQLLQDFASELA
jgi:kynurenine 3-monooxygenase